MITNGVVSGSLRDVATRHYEDGSEKLRLEPIQLTEKKLIELGLSSQVAKAQSAVVRLRVNRSSSTKTLPAGSGHIFSPDGFGLTNWHVVDFFGILKGRQFYADFTLLPGQSPPIKLPEDQISKRGIIDDRSFGSDDTRITVYSVPITILETSKEEDLALFAIDIPETQDPWPYTPIIDEVPKKGKEVFVTGHKGGTRHSLFSPGRVIDESFSFGAKTPKEFAEVKKLVSSLPSTPFTPVALGSIKTSCRTGGGASGGALFMENGEEVRVAGTINAGAGRLRVLFVNFIDMLNGRIRDREEYPPAGYELIRGTKESGIPFLRKCGLNIDALLKGNPARTSNVIKKEIEKS